MIPFFRVEGKLTLNSVCSVNSEFADFHCGTFVWELLTSEGFPSVLNAALTSLSDLHGNERITHTQLFTFF